MNHVLSKCAESASHTSPGLSELANDTLGQSEQQGNHPVRVRHRTTHDVLPLQGNGSRRGANSQGGIRLAAHLTLGWYVMRFQRIPQLSVLTIATLLIISFFSACTMHTDTSFRVTPTFEDDREIAPFPPSVEELHPTQSSIVLAPIQKQESLSQHHQSFAETFLTSLFEEAGQLNVLPQYRVDQALKQEAFRNYSGGLVEDALSLGESLQADYVAMVSLKPSLRSVKAGEWAQELQLSIYKVSTTVRVLEQSLHFSTRGMHALWRRLKPHLQQAFPQQGFILESRGSHQYVKINLGAQQQIEVGRHFGIFERNIESDVVNDTKTLYHTSYKHLGNMRIIYVEANTSWGLVQEGKRPLIREGHAVFTSAE